uniref:DUF1236 domain-containing protein n=1 Tax=Rhodopseudomonas palustris (strain BisA53) TaxID=316055 RepID=Q07IW7_RHOP5
MKKYLSMFLAGTMLVSGATAAAAGGMSKSENRADNSSQTTVGSTQKGGQLTLTEAQKKKLWNDLSAKDSAQTPPPSFMGQVGEVVPSNFSTKELPQQAQQEVPIVQNYRYAMLDDRIVLVNPQTNRVAGVIREQ